MRITDALRRFLARRLPRSRAARALAWERHFNAALAALSRPGDRGAARDAERQLLAALADAAPFDAADPRLAATFDSLTRFYLAAGKPAQAERHCRRALELKEAAFGGGSSRLATTLGDLAAACRALGREEEAARHRARALAILEAELGPDLPELSRSLDQATRSGGGPPDDSR
jgi:eukaryotic-like serine/threonine-protein kinase